MSWQDVVIGIGQFVFALALIPAVRSAEQKPPMSTCLMTGGLLVVFAITYASLSLWLAVASVLLCAAGWFTLAWQQRR